MNDGRERNTGAVVTDYCVRDWLLFFRIATLVLMPRRDLIFIPSQIHAHSTMACATGRRGTAAKLLALGLSRWLIVLSAPHTTTPTTQIRDHAPIRCPAHRKSHSVPPRYGGMSRGRSASRPGTTSRDLCMKTLHLSTEKIGSWGLNFIARNRKWLDDGNACVIRNAV